MLLIYGRGQVDTDLPSLFWWTFKSDVAEHQHQPSANPDPVAIQAPAIPVSLKAWGRSEADDPTKP